MERDLFASRFRAAAQRARDFARTFFEEPLPNAMRFRVRLNASYDGTASDVFRLYPDDGSPEIARTLATCTGEAVIATLWREGMVPQWINVSTIGLSRSATLIEVLCCGRFTSDESLLYHEREGRPPFHVLGPALPPGYEDGQKFSIYHQSDCWTADELQRVADQSGKVWSLDLQGPVFDDVTVAALPTFEKMRILELNASPIHGSGLTGLDRQPSLRVFRLDLLRGDQFTARSLPKMPYLETLSVSGLPPDDWGFATLAQRLDGLQWLSLSSSHTLDLHGRLRARPQSVKLTAPRVIGRPLPPELDAVYLDLSEATDREVEGLLENVDSLSALGLSGTPVSGALAERLAGRWELESLNLHGTRASEGEIRRIAEAHPETRVFPKPDRGD